MIFPLVNTIKNFAWGSSSSFSDLFDIPNPQKIPQAELWMGDHPLGCSKVMSSEGKEIELSALIRTSPQEMLGASHEGSGLSYLMKILAANEPLSIQVHPNKESAQAGYARENLQGIAINSPVRNYKDPNHKPELVVAITPYLAMNGFREIDEICELFLTLEIDSLTPKVKELKLGGDDKALKQFFTHIMLMGEHEKQTALEELEKGLNHYPNRGSISLVEQLIQDFLRLYPNDVGILSPLLFNIVELMPGEAMFLHAETPHAYVKGTAIEVMASSDNVLRAGLTPKHIDVPELLKNTRFVPIKKCELKVVSQKEGDIIRFPVPVDDFHFEVIELSKPFDMTDSIGPEILLCTEGDVFISGSGCSLKMTRGQSVFIPASTQAYQLSGEGKIARTYK